MSSYREFVSNTFKTLPASLSPREKMSRVAVLWRQSKGETQAKPKPKAKGGSLSPDRVLRGNSESDTEERQTLIQGGKVAKPKAKPKKQPFVMDSQHFYGWNRVADNSYGGGLEVKSSMPTRAAGFDSDVESASDEEGGKMKKKVVRKPRKPKVAEHKMIELQIIGAALGKPKLTKSKK